MPPSPIPMPWSWRRWTSAATRRRGSCSARRSTLSGAAYRFLHQLSIAQGPGPRRQPQSGGGISLGSSPPPGARRGRRSKRCRTPRTTHIFAPEPWQSRLGAWASEQSQPVESRQALGRGVAADGTPIRHSLRRARHCRTRPMSPWMCRGRPIGAAIVCMRKPWSSGWKASSASMTVHDGREPCRDRRAPARRTLVRDALAALSLA